MTATRPPAACLIGWPAAHSRSPLIHHYWLRKLGIAGGYVIEAVPPDELQDFVFRLVLRGFVGANVTIPHKERVLKLSKADARARAVGAANTLWFADGELCSTNTDVEGFLNNLDASAPGWDRAEEVLVLGAGGAARGVVFGLLERGIKRVRARRSVRRQGFSGRLGGIRQSPAARKTSGQHHFTRHGPRDARPRCRQIAAGCCGFRSGLCAAQHGFAFGGESARIEDRRRARHALASGGARL
jgi:shikimate 5-dehydrogenase